MLFRSGVGMLTVGVIGAAFLGNIQDKHIDTVLAKNSPAVHAQVVGETKSSVFGTYRALDQEKIAALPAQDRQSITDIINEAKKGALFTVAVFPAIMLVCFLILIFYFKSKGGYSVVHLEEAKS